jgi:hypothetical protein
MDDAADRGPEPPAFGQPQRALLLGFARNPTAAVSGTIIADSVLATESARRTSLRDLVLAELVTVIVYWLAHVYAEFLGAPTGAIRQAGRRRLVTAMAHEWPIVTASFVPLTAVLLASLAGTSIQTATLAGMWAGVGALVLWGQVAGRRHGARRWTALAYGLVAGVFGFTLILLRVLLH